MAMPTSRHRLRATPGERPLNIDETLPLNKEQWMTFGACASLDSSYDLFFPETREQERDAKDICSTCPVAWECFDFSIRNRECWGIWGGMNFPERCDFTHQYRGHTSPTARAAHRRLITELNRNKHNAHRSRRLRK